MAAKHYLNYNPEVAATADDSSVRQYSSSVPGEMGNSNNEILGRMFDNDESHLKVDQNVIFRKFFNGQSNLINSAGETDDYNPDFPNGHISFNFAGASLAINIRDKQLREGNGIQPTELELASGASNSNIGRKHTKKYHPDLSYPSKVDLDFPSNVPDTPVLPIVGIESNPDKGYGSNNSQLGINPGLADAHIREDGEPGTLPLRRSYDENDIMHRSSEE